MTDEQYQEICAAFTEARTTVMDRTALAWDSRSQAERKTVMDADDAAVSRFYELMLAARNGITIQS